MSRPLLPESAFAALGLDSDTIKILTTPKPPSDPDIFAPNLLQSNEDGATATEPNQTAITLYAELLLHVRTVSLFASLRTQFSRETKAKMSSDGNSITVEHEGRTAKIYMPFNIQGGGDAELSLPAQPASKEITLRMQLEELQDSDILGALQSEDRRMNVVPWDGASLDKEKDLEIRCKSCDSLVVDRGTIAQWRDLPNENWAEMMDFWHCHKPDEHHLHDHTHEDAIGQKGYAAGNRLQAAQSIGFVDLTSFLLKEEDCKGAQAAVSETTKETFIVCKHCSGTLGSQDESTSGWRIWKWNIDVGHNSSPDLYKHVYSTPKWISARLLYLVENTGLRKFHIHPTPPSTSNEEEDAPSSNSDTEQTIPSLLVWVFTPDLLFSSSTPSEGRADPTRAIKVFYQQQTWQPIKPGEPESATIEDVEFPEQLFRELKSTLEESQQLLPPTTRKFQGWLVGLIDRFDLRDVMSNEDLAALAQKHGLGNGNVTRDDNNKGLFGLL